MKSPRVFTIVLSVTGSAAPAAFAAGDAYGEFAARGGHVETPISGLESPEHIGAKAHTNFKFFFPNAGKAIS